LVEKDIMIGFFVEKNEFEERLKKFTKELEDNLKNLGFRYVFISFKKSLSPLKEFVIEKNVFSLKI
jgi:PP-loop superfamily ATP-utilizing enzyme